MSKRLILPYASLDENRKQPFSGEMELASILCLVEAKRKRKPGILRGEPEETVSVSKLYYPFWLIPSENGYVTIDGMKILSFEGSYATVSDLASFIMKLETSKASYGQFMEFLNQNSKTFSDFASSEVIVIEGIVQDKELQSALLDYFKNEFTSGENQPNESAFLKERLNEEAASSKTNELTALQKKNHADEKALQQTISALSDTAEEISKTLLQNAENIKGESAAKIEALRPSIEEKIARLTAERDARIKSTQASVERELEVRAAERAEYEITLEALEQERSDFKEKEQLAKLRKNEANVKSWNLRVKERDRRISKLKTKMRNLENRIDETKKDMEKTVKQTDEAYQGQINAEMDKVPLIEAERDNKIAEIQTNLEEMHSETAYFAKQIQGLLEEKHGFDETLRKSVIPLKIEDTVLVYVPFWAVNYKGESVQRFDFHAPIFVSSPGGLLKRIRMRFWGFSLESRMGVLLRQRSKALEKMFSLMLPNKIREDHELGRLLTESAEHNNVLSSSWFQEAFAKSMEKLVEEEWVKPGEKELILKVFRK